MQRIVSFTLLAMLTVAMVGCGSKKPAVQKVTGKVTLDGKPLADARVTLHIQGEGRPRKPSGTTDADGNVTIMYPHSLEEALEGAPLGSYKITVAKVKKSTADPDEDPDKAMEDYIKQMGSQKMAGEGSSVADPTASENLIPTKYGQPPFTPFTIEVKEGENTFNLELKSDFK